LLVVSLTFFQLRIEVADDSEIRILGCHEFIFPQRGPHISDRAFHIGAKLFNNFRVDLHRIELK
jgi:hypothetical protein